MKIGAIIQARTSSTRLPRKVLKNLPYASGITVLQHVIRRLKRSKRLSDIIVATTLDKTDDEIARISQKEDAKYFRGSMNNVLERHYLAAKENGLDMVVRVTSDCPCIDSEIVDLIIDKHMEVKPDYTSNSVKKTYPHGLDAEVFNFKTLERAYRDARDDYDKEHVTSYIYENPSLFKIVQVEASKELYAPDIRITLDTEKDYRLLCAVFDCLYPKNKYFTASDIVNFFREKVSSKI